MGWLARRSALVLAFLVALSVGACGAPLVVRIVNLDTSQASVARVTVNDQLVLSDLAFGATSSYLVLDAASVTIKTSVPAGDDVQVFTRADTNVFTVPVFLSVVLHSSTLGLSAAVFQDNAMARLGYTMLRAVNFRHVLATPLPTGTLSVSANGTAVISNQPLLTATNADLYAHVAIADGPAMLSFSVLSAQVAQANISATGSGAITCFAYTTAAGAIAALCAPPEHSRGGSVPLEGESNIEGGTLTRALAIAPGALATVVGDADLYNDGAVATGGTLRLRGKLTVVGTVSVSSGAVLAVDGANAGELATFGLSLAPGASLVASHLLAFTSVIAVQGAAQLNGSSLVFDTRNMQFFAGTELVVLTCAPCVGNFSSLQLVGFDESNEVLDSGLEARAVRVGQRASVLSATNATVTCSSSQCVLRANGTLGFNRTASGSQTDKIVIGVLLVIAALVLIALLVVRAVCVTRPRKPGVRPMDEQIDRTLREHDRMFVKEQRVHRVRDNVLHSDDIDISVAEFRSTSSSESP